MHALPVPICLYEYQLDSQKINLVRLWLTNIDYNSHRCPYLFETKPLKLSLIKNYDSSDINAGPFRRFPTYIWQNAHLNIVRHVMMCDVHFPFPKIL